MFEIPRQLTAEVPRELSVEVPRQLTAEGVFWYFTGVFQPY